MGRHLTQLWYYALHVLLGIDEGENDGQFPTSVHQRGSFHAASPSEAGHRVDHRSTRDILRLQIVKDRDMQRSMQPLIGFIEVNGDL